MCVCMFACMHACMNECTKLARVEASVDSAGEGDGRRSAAELSRLGPDAAVTEVSQAAVTEVSHASRCSRQSTATAMAGSQPRR